MDDLSQKIKEFNRKRISNRIYISIFSLFSLSLVLYGLFNRDKDTLFEYIFFFITTTAVIINTYVFLKKSPLIPKSSNPKELLLKKYEEMVNLTNYFILGYMQPLLIGNFAIIAFEFPSEEVIKAPLMIVLFLFLILGMYIENRTRKFATKNYEELTGSKLIIFFP